MLVSFGHPYSEVANYSLSTLSVLVDALMKKLRAEAGEPPESKPKVYKEYVKDRDGIIRRQAPTMGPDPFKAQPVE
jgi:hypothetical protein